ncbi:uncharacterized protein LAJ45_03644 [Morchella importuna]|uniref:uncharacterized protein n=1 Tax=Morchella importuna TaxID=1174673 RepID=UPI001E8DDE60|nr:uncharacterized protein LAJ45_03644 [Morchella importuna]KAH8152218.1 hypothetical protein LAJ45_03644 [Morchella importuna]
MPRATYATRASMRVAKTRSCSTGGTASTSASQLRTTAAAALQANSQLHSSSSAGAEVQSSSSTTEPTSPDPTSFRPPFNNLDSPPTNCPYCPFTVTSNSIEFEGFNIMLHPCPCGQEHAHAAKVLAHHLSSCPGKARPDNTSSLTTAPPSAQTFEEDALPAPRRRRRRAPGENPPALPHPTAVDLQPTIDGPDCANYASQQRTSPRVCITCTQPFTTRVHVFKNGRMHTPFMLYRCGCGERFSREYPNMRVRIDIKQEEHQALETDIELARERVRKEFESVGALTVRKRVRSKGGKWVLAKGVESEGEEEGQGSKEKPTYLSRAEMSDKWKEYAYGRGMRRKSSKLICEVCGVESADADKAATHRREHQDEESEMERSNTTCECGSVFRTKEGLEAHGSLCRLVKKNKRRKIGKK